MPRRRRGRHRQFLRMVSNAEHACDVAAAEWSRHLDFRESNALLWIVAVAVVDSGDATLGVVKHLGYNEARNAVGRHPGRGCSAQVVAAEVVNLAVDRPRRLAALAVAERPGEHVIGEPREAGNAPTPQPAGS